MVNSDVVKFFKNNLSNWFGETNYPDCMTYVNHQQDNNSLLPNFRSNFSVELQEEILFTRDTSFWNSSDQGLVITDDGVYCIPDNENKQDGFFLSWKDINDVSYKEYCFYFFNSEGELLGTIHSSYFFKSIDDSKLESRVGRSLASSLSEMAKLAGKQVGLYDEVLELEDAEEYDDALEKINSMMSNPNIKNDAYSHFFKGRILLKKEWTIEDEGDEQRFNAINHEFEKAMELTDDESLPGYCNYWRAHNYKTYGQNYNARNLFMASMDSDSDDIKEDSKQEFEIAEEKLSEIWDNYTSQYDYQDRKFIMPIQDSQIAGCLASGIDTFRMSNIPSCFKFPIGHPIANELYIGHPYNPSVYVPYESSEDIFFVDKIHELCYLLQCLGAEEISITSIKGKNVSELRDYDTVINGQADISLLSMNGELGKSGSIENNRSSNIQRTMVQRYDPLKKPYVPDGLIWFPEQTKWQRLVESRLNGNLLEYNEFVSTMETKFVTNTERSSIKASAEYLWSKVNGSSDSQSKSQFKESIETQWKVEVKFRSMKLFNQGNTFTNSNDSQTIPQLTHNEQEYLENIREFLEDDAEITPRERKMLDRIRQSMGISEERAKELEASLAKPQLTEDEQEYLDMYHEYSEKGEVTEKERRRLDKFASAMGLSPERVKEIEMIK